MLYSEFLSVIDEKAKEIGDISDAIWEKPELCFQEHNAVKLLTEKLEENGFTVTLTQVIGVRVPDTPGGLSVVLRLLSDNGISLEYMYAFIGRSDEKASVILRVDNDEKAAQILSSNGIELISGDAFNE